MKVPFNKPFFIGAELENISQAVAEGHLSGNGHFTKRCHHWLEERLGCARALLTHSCTGALEMAALLANIKPGDEVIMPSYTFVSTANAFVLRGGTPVFVDIQEDTFNIDAALIDQAVTSRTRAIAVVHYAGVGCDMERIVASAKKHDLLVIEDAAQAMMASYRNRPLGAIGDLGALSFHETKNLISGEGGALIVNTPELVERAEILWEKGTNRTQFFRGEVDKYTWLDVGSSFLPSELVSAFLWAQMQAAEEITRRRLDLWSRYHDAFAGAERDGLVRRPIVPPGCQHNAHMYYLLLPDLARRTRFIETLKAAGIHSVFHYVPLHSSPGGVRFGRTGSPLPVTQSISERIVRLPLWIGLEPQQDYVVAAGTRGLAPHHLNRRSQCARPSV